MKRDDNPLVIPPLSVRALLDADEIRFKLSNTAFYRITNGTHGSIVKALRVRGLVVYSQVADGMILTNEGESERRRITELFPEKVGTW